MDRVRIVHDNLCTRLQSGDYPEGAAPASGLDAAREIFRAQCLSRALDRTSRVLQSQGQGFYTIGSSGHEGMAAVAQATRTSDMAFLHYRDAAFQLMRAQQAGMDSAVWDMLLSFACAKADPISGGRHKVLGSKALNIPPQTSTIASHLPKAVGAAFSIGLAKRQPPEHRVLDDDSIVLCSFGDASLNHSTAQGAINTACWTAYQSMPLPLLFVCEDNGIGISVKTPKGWVAANMANRAGLRYFAANGCDMYQTYAAAQAASDYVRQTRKPAFLHLSLVRLYGHAGADIAASYLSPQEIEAAENNDPLLHSARLLVAAGVMNTQEALEMYLNICAEVTALAEHIPAEPRLRNAAEVMASLIPRPRQCAITTVTPLENPSKSPMSLSKGLNLALREAMQSYPETVLMGEDIGRKGGVYGVTQKLQEKFGNSRVVDTLLDEQSILGLAMGLAHNGFTPIPEIQFLAYLHNAEDQLRGEAATLSFFSDGQFTNPMLLRIAGLGYQKGFGGHFHNDNSLAVLRDIPGLIVACPNRASEAILMFREALRLVRQEQRLVVFLEPIALYATKDLYETGDNGWLDGYPDTEETVDFGTVQVIGDGTDVALISYGNGAYLCQQAAKELAEKHGISARVINIRWLVPLPEQSIHAAIQGCTKILIVDECRRSGNIAEGLLRILHGYPNVEYLAAEDSFIATGPAFAATMPSRDTIVAHIYQTAPC